MGKRLKFSVLTITLFSLNIEFSISKWPARLAMTDISPVFFCRNNEIYLKVSRGEKKCHKGWELNPTD